MTYEISESQIAALATLSENCEQHFRVSSFSFFVKNSVKSLNHRKISSNHIMQLRTRDFLRHFWTDFKNSNFCETVWNGMVLLELIFYLNQNTTKSLASRFQFKKSSKNCKNLKVLVKFRETNLTQNVYNTFTEKIGTCIMYIQCLTSSPANFAWNFQIHFSL